MNTYLYKKKKSTPHRHSVPKAEWTSSFRYVMSRPDYFLVVFLVTVFLAVVFFAVVFFVAVDLAVDTVCTGL